MRYRALDPTGDYTFGQNGQNYYTNTPQAVAQACYTRLSLYLGAFWRDVNDGLPLYQSILQAPGSPESLALVEAIILARIKGTKGLKSVLSYSNSFDHGTRKYSFQADIDTIYGQTSIAGNA